MVKHLNAKRKIMYAIDKYIFYKTNKVIHSNDLTNESSIF